MGCLPRVALFAVCVALVGVAYLAVFTRPSNERDWEYGVETLPHITFDDDTINVQRVRDFHYAADGASEAGYVDRTLDTRRLERVWFIEEPFTIPPFEGFEGVAHTYFVFDFADQPPVAVSVEARRERGESYDVARGMLNTYELIYIWGTEQDLTGRRALVEHNELYMHPLHIPIEAARALLVQLATESQRLETEPRFYNSLTSNCTNELASAANVVQPNAVPLNIALVLPGFADNLLYDLGFIAHDAPLDELRRRAYITDVVAAESQQADFSSRLRAELQKRAA